MPLDFLKFDTYSSPIFSAKVLHIELVVKGSDLLFKPPFSELDAIVQRLIITIVESGQKLPRVEHVLFPDLEGKEMIC